MVNLRFLFLWGNHVFSQPQPEDAHHLYHAHTEVSLLGFGAVGALADLGTQPNGA